jgi:hypothetical protein
MYPEAFIIIILFYYYEPIGINQMSKTISQLFYILLINIY